MQRHHDGEDDQVGQAQRRSLGQLLESGRHFEGIDPGAVAVEEDQPAVDAQRAQRGDDGRDLADGDDQPIEAAQDSAQAPSPAGPAAAMGVNGKARTVNATIIAVSPIIELTDRSMPRGDDDHRLGQRDDRQDRDIQQDIAASCCSVRKLGLRRLTSDHQQQDEDQMMPTSRKRARIRIVKSGFGEPAGLRVDSTMLFCHSYELVTRSVYDRPAWQPS